MPIEFKTSKFFSLIEFSIVFSNSIPKLTKNPVLSLDTVMPQSLYPFGSSLWYLNLKLVFRSLNIPNLLLFISSAIW